MTAELKPKPDNTKKKYAARCSRCGGTGQVDLSFAKREIDKTCFECKGKGWKMVKRPKRSKNGKRKRPEYSGSKDTVAYWHFYHELKLYLLSHRGNRCEKCGMSFKNQKLALDNLHMHHVVMRQNGGSDDDNNLLLLCVKCHQDQHSFTLSCLTPV